MSFQQPLRDEHYQGLVRSLSPGSELPVRSRGAVAYERTGGRPIFCIEVRKLSEENNQKTLRHRRSKFARPSIDRYDGDHTKRTCWKAGMASSYDNQSMHITTLRCMALLPAYPSFHLRNHESEIRLTEKDVEGLLIDGIFGRTESGH